MSLRIIYTGRSEGIGLGDLLEYLESINELSGRLRIFKQFAERERNEHFGVGKILKLKPEPHNPKNTNTHRVK